MRVLINKTAAPRKTAALRRKTAAQRRKTAAQHRKTAVLARCLPAIRHKKAWSWWVVLRTPMVQGRPVETTEAPRNPQEGRPVETTKPEGKHWRVAPRKMAQMECIPAAHRTQSAEQGPAAPCTQVAAGCTHARQPPSCDLCRIRGSLWRARLDASRRPRKMISRTVLWLLSQKMY